MSLTESFVSGWVPSYGDDDDVDISNSYPVTLPDELLSSPSLSRTSSNDSHSHHFSSIENAPSPGSSVDGSHTDPSYPPFSSSDRRALRNRQRDPDWVPRPRNAFIIFRCEYSRKHARDSNDTSDKSTRSDKTLSKRAAEEWRCLSAEEREQYKILAVQEKAAHALQNPDYRFKPVRRTPPGVVSRSRPSTCRRTDRSAQVASLIMRSERGVSSVPRDGDVHEHKVNYPEPATVPASSSTVATGRRRSASMPQPVAAPETVVIPAKARTPVPISCMSSPGPSVVEFDRLSCSEIDSPLYTPVLPTSPALHGLPSGFQMLTLPEHQPPSNEAFECCMGIGGARVCFHRSTFSIFCSQELFSIRIPRLPSVPHQGLTVTRTPIRVRINTSDSRLPTAIYTPLRWSL
jgi:HMG (high mobility group) box